MQGEKRFKKYAILYLFLFVSLSIFSSVPYAYGTEYATDTIKDALNTYSYSLEEAYLQGASYNQLANRNIITKDPTLGGALTVQRVRVNPEIINVSPINAGYNVDVLVTTTIDTIPNSNASILIGDSHVGNLHSIAQDAHRWTISSGGARSGHYRVTNDEWLESFATEEGQDSDKTDTAFKERALGTIESVNTVVGGAKVSSSANKAGLDYLKEIQYAEKWTETDAMNEDFPIYKEGTGEQGNCTNFVSQALYAGGLPLRGGTTLDIRNDNVWTWNLSGIAQASHTWSGADNNYRFMKNNSGAFVVENNPNRIGPGGIIYADWDGADAQGNFVLNHAMIVVGNVNTASASYPIICQKTHNRHDWPFTKTEKWAHDNYGAKTVWRGLQVDFSR